MLKDGVRIGRITRKPKAVLVAELEDSSEGHPRQQLRVSTQPCNAMKRADPLLVCGRSGVRSYGER